MPTPITIPLLNPNEPEALLAALHVEEGQYVHTGESLCTLETTKSTAELEAESDGYVIGIQYSAGQTVTAGALLCTLAETRDWRPPEEINQQENTPLQLEEIPAGLRISQPALALARQLNIPMDRLPAGIFITESMVHTLSEQSATAPQMGQVIHFDPTAIIVYGGGGHGKMVIEMLRSLGVYRIAGVLDDGIPAGAAILGVPVLGGGEALAGLYEQGIRLAANAVGGIGNLSTRIKIFQRLSEAGFACPALVHPSAYIEPSAVLSPGVHVFPHAYLGSDVRAGFGAIINTGVIVSHDCVLGDFTNISPGAILAGGVEVGERTLIGMGATINLLVKVGKGARIGNGATVKSDVPDGALVHAGSIYPG